MFCKIGRLIIIATFSLPVPHIFFCRSEKTILPEQSQLDEKRSGSSKTLFDQMVDFMNRHKKQFPIAIHDAAHKEEDPEQALLKRIRNIVERMLKFYMKGKLNI